MSKKNVIAIAVGILTLITLWLLMTFISSFVVYKLDNLIIAGNYVQDSWSFYSNAHLLEEMYKEEYHPLRDPIFLASIIVIYAPAFLIGALLSRNIADNALPPYITVAAGAFLVMIIRHHDIFNRHSSLIQPICFEFAVIIVALATGLYIGKRMKTKHGNK